MRILGVVALVAMLAGCAGCAPDLAALSKDKSTLCFKFNGWGGSVDLMRSNPDTKDNISVNCNGASITAPGAVQVPAAIQPNAVSVPVDVPRMTLTPTK